MEYTFYCKDCGKKIDGTNPVFWYHGKPICTNCVFKKDYILCSCNELFDRNEVDCKSHEHVITNCKMCNENNDKPLNVCALCNERIYENSHLVTYDEDNKLNNIQKLTEQNYGECCSCDGLFNHQYALDLIDIANEHICDYCNNVVNKCFYCTKLK